MVGNLSLFKLLFVIKEEELAPLIALTIVPAIAISIRKPNKPPPPNPKIGRIKGKPIPPPLL